MRVAMQRQVEMRLPLFSWLALSTSSQPYYCGILRLQVKRRFFTLWMFPFLVLYFLNQYPSVVFTRPSYAGAATVPEGKISGNINSADRRQKEGHQDQGTLIGL